MEYSDKIRKQLKIKGIDEMTILNQVNQFVDGIPAIELQRACVIGDGIIQLDQEEVVSHKANYETRAKELNLVKFVPASGAATRMFKHLFEYQPPNNTPLVDEFFNRLEEFPFYPKLKKELPEISTLVQEKKYQPIITTLLDTMKYGNLPKGSIPFHQYEDEIRTAFEEHLYEGKDYCTGKNDKIAIHFTIPEKHQKSIFELLKKKVHQSFVHENMLLNFSFQQSNTDTITVDMDNTLVTDGNDQLVFRPGGHGALIYNLNAIEADLIFIKNIDNILPQDKREDTIMYKKALANVALEMADIRNDILKNIDEGLAIDQEKLNHFSDHFKISIEDQSTDSIYQLLNRPIRVCGMVKNQNEPGGGPYWVKDEQGNISKQIVEKSQINLDAGDQYEIFNEATHFNPVDLICITKNHQGVSYDLLKFVDDKTGFISKKSKQGKPIKALELPGLWNGAMAHWNTLFVEVPLSTFNPVKTVNDLIRPIRLPSPKLTK